MTSSPSGSKPSLVTSFKMNSKLLITAYNPALSGAFLNASSTTFLCFLLLSDMVHLTASLIAKYAFIPNPFTHWCPRP